MIDAPWLTAFLRQARFPRGTERMLQQAIWGILRGLESEVCRAEHWLNKEDRIDFFIDGVGIEAKLNYPKRKIYRQLERYSRHDEIQALILITGTTLGLPPKINGKPVFYVSLGRASL